jgi:hypothetical protein
MSKILRIILVVVLGFFTTCFASETVCEIYGFVEDFSWKEQVSYISGDFVDESGLRYGLGADIDMFSEGGFGILFGGEAYIGSVDYKGGIQNSLTGEYVPYDSKTSYYGMRGNFDLGYRFDNGNYVLTPYCGYGLEIWDRVLDADLFDSAGGYGYSELWIYSTIRLGASGQYFYNNNVSIFGDICLDLFPYVSEYINSDSGNVILEPEGEIGFAFEVGLSYNNLMFSFFWKERQFDKSEEDGGFYQPNSDERCLGVQAGIKF